MKTVIKIAFIVAALIAMSIAYLNFSEERRQRLEAEEKAQLEAEYKQLFADSSKHKIPQTDPIENPKIADMGWDLQRLGAGPASLSEYRGRTIFIDVWATWCKPCIAQMPSIQKLYEQHQSEEYAFLLISPEDEEIVGKFLAAHDYTLPFYLTGDQHPETFDIRPLPFTYVINPRGEIVYQNHGGPNQYDSESFVEFFRSWSEEPEAS